MDEWNIVVHKDECQYQSYFKDLDKHVLTCCHPAVADNENECKADNCPIRYIKEVWVGKGIVLSI